MVRRPQEALFLFFSMCGNCDAEVSVSRQRNKRIGKRPGGGGGGGGKLQFKMGEGRDTPVFMNVMRTPNPNPAASHEDMMRFAV